MGYIKHISILQDMRIPDTVLVSLSRFAQVVEIIKQDKHKYGFLRCSLSDEENDSRCAIGLLLSHYGWDGMCNFSNSLYIADRRLDELISSYEQKVIADINDNSNSFDEVIDKLSAP